MTRSWRTLPAGPSESTWRSPCSIGIQISCQQTFIALGNAKTSVFLALLRKVILLIPLIYILPYFLADKVFAVFLAEPVADFIAVSTTATLFYRQIQEKL